MAGTHVLSVRLSYGQSVSWSGDNRIAISVDEEIRILKLDSSFKCSSATTRLNTVKILSAEKLKDRNIPWSSLAQIYPMADASVQSAFSSQWTYSDLKDPSIVTSWGPMVWSPFGVSSTQRSVLVGLSLDHRLYIFDELGAECEWKKIVDLSAQLASEQSQEFQLALEEVSSNNDRLMKILEQMCSIAATAVAWSSILEVKKGDGECVLLFAGMKNGDVVTWKIRLPLSNLDDCSIISRCSTHKASSVTSLAWTEVEEKCSGVLGVGHADGFVSLLYVHPAANAESAHGFQMTEKVVHSEVDFMPVTSMTWAARSQTAGFILLYGKEQAVVAHSVGITDNPSGQTDIQLKHCTHTRFGNWLPCSSLHQQGSTILMTSEDGSVWILTVEDSPSGLAVECEKQLHFDFQEPDWGCVSACLSPSAVFCIALFRPNFHYNYKNRRFKDPAHVHVCPVPKSEFSSIEALLSSNEAIHAAREDALEFARQVVCQRVLDEEMVVTTKNRLISDHFLSSHFGLLLSRYLLGSLCSLCESLVLDPKVAEDVEAAKARVTETLLCNHIRAAWSKYSSALHQTTDEDIRILQAMLTWVQAADGRTGLLGSEVMAALTAAVNQQAMSSEHMQCVLCGTKQEFDGLLTVKCDQKHAFGLCCQTLMVCDDVPFQVCGTCGVFARSSRQLAKVGWLVHGPSRCTLCGGFLSSSTAHICF